MDLDPGSPVVWIPAVLVAAVAVGLLREAVVETVVAAVLLAGAMFTFRRMGRT